MTQTRLESCGKLAYLTHAVITSNSLKPQYLPATKTACFSFRRNCVHKCTHIHAFRLGLLTHNAALSPILLPLPPLLLSRHVECGEGIEFPFSRGCSFITLRDGKILTVCQILLFYSLLDFPIISKSETVHWQVLLSSSFGPTLAFFRRISIIVDTPYTCCWTIGLRRS